MSRYESEIYDKIKEKLSSYCGTNIGTIMSTDYIYLELRYLIFSSIAVEVRNNCSDPGIPINGIRIGNDFSIGSMVFYRCNDGFIIMGSKVRTCQGDGVFSGMQPYCEPFMG